MMKDKPEFLGYSTLDVTSPGIRAKQVVQKAMTAISPTLNVQMLNLYHFGRFINLKAPRDFNEKLNWMKVHTYRNNPLIRRCSDKFDSKLYLAEQGLGHLPVENLATYTSAHEIDWDVLPQKFMLKWNHGYGMNIFVLDKDAIDRQAVVKQLDVWQKVDYWKFSAEMQYQGIPKVLICEKFIETESGELDDYKIYCFNGKPVFGNQGVGRRLGKPVFYYYDFDWNQLFLSSAYGPDDGILLPEMPPPHLKEMVEAAGILCKPFPFVRVDFYDTPDKLYFGELTFTPRGGYGKAKTQEALNWMGDMIDLEYKPE